MKQNYIDKCHHRTAKVHVAPVIVHMPVFISALFFSFLFCVFWPWLKSIVLSKQETESSA